MVVDQQHADGAGAEVAGGRGARHAVAAVRVGRRHEVPLSGRGPRRAPGAGGCSSVYRPRPRASAPDNRPMRVAFLGLGLIGGSVARAVRGAQAVGGRRPAWTPSRRRAAAALAAGRDRRSPPDAGRRRGRRPGRARRRRRSLRGPRRRARRGRARRSSRRRDRDRRRLDQGRDRTSRRAGVPFVGGHPMAGREVTGFAAGTPTLFRDRPWVITEAGGRGRRRRGPAARDGLRREPVHAGRARATTVRSRRSATCRCSRRWRSWRRSPGRARSRGRLGRGGGARGRRLARHDPARPRRRDDGRGDRRHERRGHRRALRDVPRRIDEWLALLEAGAGPDERARTRGSRPPAPAASRATP